MATTNTPAISRYLLRKLEDLPEDIRARMRGAGSERSDILDRSGLGC
jgi:hypothetical protein